MLEKIKKVKEQNKERTTGKYNEKIKREREIEQE